jgi:hypothetical protein
MADLREIETCADLGKSRESRDFWGAACNHQPCFFFLGGTCFPKNIKVGLKLEVTNLLGDKFGQLYDDTIFNKGHGWHFGKNNYPG